jgi:hypothetical protein
VHSISVGIPPQTLEWLSSINDGNAIPPYE